MLALKNTVFYKEINYKELKKIIIYTFIFGLIAHGYAYFNTNFSYDSLCDIYEKSSVHMLSIGRYIRPLYRLIRGNFTLPTLIGFLSLLFLAVAFYFIIDSLRIHNKYYKILTCGILVTNFAFSELNATYIHDADSYSFALMLIAVAVWLSLKNSKYLLISGILFFFSLGIYQAYINVAIIIYLIDAFIKLSKNENWKEILITLLKRLTTIIISMAIYFVGAIIIQRISHTNMTTDYQSPSSILKLSIDTIASRFHKMYASEKRWFFNPPSNNLYLIRTINIISLIIVVYLVYTQLKKCNSKINIILSLVILLLMPFGINTVTLLSNIYHDLIMYSFFFYYIFILILLEQNPDFSFSNLIKNISMIIMSILIADNIIFSNVIYLKKDLEYDSTLSVITRVIDRVEQTDGYVPGVTPVAIVGTLNKSNIQLNREGMPNKSTGLWNNYVFGYYETYEKYFNYLLGYNINLVDEEIVKTLNDNEYIKKMPSFPDKNSIKIIDGLMIIKFSD